MKKNHILFLVIIVAFCRCQKSSTPPVSPCNAGTSYSATVRPILITNCAKSDCHDGNYLPSLADYNIAHDGATQIKSDINSGRMPKGSTLKVEDKAAILCWIDNGSKNN
nr:hypothetical protein [uncultured Pedobacter sp.]